MYTRGFILRMTATPSEESQNIWVTHTHPDKWNLLLILKKSYNITRGDECKFAFQRICKLTVEVTWLQNDIRLILQPRLIHMTNVGNLAFIWTQEKRFVMIFKCRQAKGHYLNQCWFPFMSPHSATRPQWVKYPTWPYALLHINGIRS